MTTRVCADVSDYLIYMTYDGIYGLYIDPDVTSQPFPPITTVTGMTTFDLSYENNTLLVVSNRRLKKVAFDNNKVMDTVTAVNTSGLFSSQLFQSKRVNLLPVDFAEEKPWSRGLGPKSYYSAAIC